MKSKLHRKGGLLNILVEHLYKFFSLCIHINAFMSNLATEWKLALWSNSRCKEINFYMQQQNACLLMSFPWKQKMSLYFHWINSDWRDQHVDDLSCLDSFVLSGTVTILILSINFWWILQYLCYNDTCLFLTYKEKNDDMLSFIPEYLNI